MLKCIDVALPQGYSACMLLPFTVMFPSMHPDSAIALSRVLRVAAFALAVSISSVLPAHAQLRADLPGEPAPVAVHGTPQISGLGSLFNARTLRLNHGYEFSYSSFGGDGLGLGIYTTSLGWQPSERLAARVDVGVAHSPFGSSRAQQALGFSQEAPARVFLQNAEIAYRPTENSVLQLQVRQSPYGSYASPYGYGSTYGSTFQTRYGGSDELFWRD